MERRERRLDERYQTNLHVTVTDLAAPERVASGQIVDISQSGVCVNLSSRFAPGAIVKAQLADCVLFGHVIDCAQVNANQTDIPQDQLFRTGIEVVRVLIGESDLARLVNAVLAEKMPATPGIRAISTQETT
jgi:hypothetical protein